MNRFFFAFLIFALATAGVECLAQPALPDISCNMAGNKFVKLSWTSQYNPPKSIAVRRANNEFSGFSTIGYVHNLKKGKQLFIDSFPQPGKWFYKLLITFNSGLEWSSNACPITVPNLPDLQKNAKHPMPPVRDTPVKKIETIKKIEKINPAPSHMPEPAPVMNKSQKPVKINPVVAPVASIASSDTATQKKIFTNQQSNKTTDQPVVKTGVAQTPAANHEKKDTTPPKKLPDSLQTKRTNTNTTIDTATLPNLFVESKYIREEAGTGNIILTMPEDFRIYHYSLYVYNSENQPVWYVPVFNEPEVIMDRRNFRRNIVYRFLMRKELQKFAEVYIEKH